MKTQSTEEMIQEKGLNAPRLTPELILSKIKHMDFHVFPGTMLTVCVLTLENGFTVTGESACVSPENFDKEVGEKVARENAVAKIWALEGYLLKERLMPRLSSETFIDRLYVERDQLSERLSKLKAFMESENHNHLSSFEVSCLNQQMISMEQYENCLNDRIAFYDK